MVSWADRMSAARKIADQLAEVDETFIPETAADWERAIKSWRWRIFGGQLYKIMTKDDEDQPGAVIPFRPNVAQRAFIARLHYRNVILKARQLGFCLETSTRVLTADLRWVRIDSLKPGDEIVSVDEKVPGGRGSARKMRTATVEAAQAVRRMGYRLTFADGREVVCTDQHPWLARSGEKRQPFWRAMDKAAPNAERALKAGHQVRSICKPWDEPTYEDGWMGGMIDGEGSIAKPCSSGAEVNIAQREGAVLDRMVRYAKDRGYTARIEVDKRKSGDASKLGSLDVHKVCFTRMNELFQLIGQTRPSRMIERRFWEGKEMPGKRNANNEAWNEIVSIEPVGMVDMIDLQTSTGTFIAEGMVSHNTTLIAIMWLDHALFTPDQRVGMIAHSLDDAAVIFRDKVKFAYDNLPPEIRALNPTIKKTESELVFRNNSSIRVSTSMRSGTIHRLHISEMGKIAAKFPQKAVEIVTGSLPAVPKNGIAIIESTAEGRSGEFFTIATRAEKRAANINGRPLGIMEFRFHFFPWFVMPDYRLNDVRDHPIMTAADHEYFDQVQQEAGVRLDLAQRAWYVAKRESEQGGDQEKMWREYPSTPGECWQRTTEGTFYAPQVARARMEGRIGRVPHVSYVPVHTFWDIGSGDGTGIWLMQYVGTQHRFIRYIENWATGYSWFVTQLRDTGYLFGHHFLPHDALHERQMKDTIARPLDMLTDLAPDWTFDIVPRVQHLQHGIQLTREKFQEAWFDEEGCAAGIDHLDNYKKKWNARIGAYSDEPEKLEGHSEAADAFRQWAQGFDPSIIAGAAHLQLSKSRAKSPKGGMAV